MRALHLILPVLALLVSCRKEQLNPSAEPQEVSTDMQKGLPPDPDKIHGYFYVMQTKPFYEPRDNIRRVYVSFAAQGGDLRQAYNFDIDELDWALVKGDVSVGVLRIDTTMVYPTFMTGPRYAYTAQHIVQSLAPAPVKWSFSGTELLPSDTFFFAEPFPVIKTEGKALLLDPDSSFTILADSFIGNFDEGNILLVGAHYRSGPYVADGITVTKDVRHLYYSAEQVREYLTPDGGSPPGTLRFKGYNHFYKYHKGKLYVFTFSSMVDCSIKLTHYN